MCIKIDPSLSQEDDQQNNTCMMKSLRIDFENPKRADFLVSTGNKTKSGELYTVRKPVLKAKTSWVSYSCMSDRKLLHDDEEAD